MISVQEATFHIVLPAILCAITVNTTIQYNSLTYQSLYFTKNIREEEEDLDQACGVLYSSRNPAEIEIIIAGVFQYSHQVEFYFLFITLPHFTRSHYVGKYLLFHFIKQPRLSDHKMTGTVQLYNTSLLLPCWCHSYETKPNWTWLGVATSTFQEIADKLIIVLIVNFLHDLFWLHYT